MTSRRPILKKNAEAFVPSPHFLSESPARQPTSSGKQTPAHISQPLSPRVFSPSPSTRQLHSPAPPPPANLFKGNASAFNVDPGIPFLATVGPSDAGNSDKGSINEPSKRLVGGFVSGLKKALSIKGSRRRSSRYPHTAEDVYHPPSIIRDSGYAASNQVEEPPLQPPLAPPIQHPPPIQPPPLTTLSQPPPLVPQDLLATSKPPFNGYQTINDQNFAPAADPHGILSPDTTASAFSARVEYGSDYAKMDRPTPPHSDVSFNTYLNRFQKFAHDLAVLPWISNERVTVDYYPTAADRHKRLPHRPAFIWHSRDYSHVDYHLDTDSESSGLKMTPHLHVRAPSRTSRADINLGSEFSGETNSPLPLHPPNIIQTPDHRRLQSKSLFPPNNGPTLEDDLLSELHVDGNPALSTTPQARKTPSLAPSRPTSKVAPYTSPLLPQNYGRTQNPSNAYTEESRPGSGNDITLLKTPAARKPSLTQSGGLAPLPSSPPNSSRTRGRSGTYGEDPTRSGTRIDTNPTFTNTPPIQPHPASIRSSLNARDRTPRRQSTPGSTSRRSRRSHTPSQRHTEEWENFPQDRPGYVPFEYSENYYGTQYGVGIHGLLPPVGHAPSNASTVPSIKQPQPQYPRSTLMTPPSRTSS